ncbi:acylphosphatase [Chloroflexota bacterium]
MTDLASVRATVHGHVQGIGFRYSTSRYAIESGLTGYVRNLSGGAAVEVEAEGERDRLEKLIEYLEAGVPGARVERVDVNWSEYRGNYPDFSIRR